MAPQSSASSPATRLWFPWAQELLAALASLHFFPGLTQRHLGCLSDAPCPSAVLPRLCSWWPHGVTAVGPCALCTCAPAQTPAVLRATQFETTVKRTVRLRRSTPGGPAGQSSIPGDSGVGSVGHTHWHLSSNVASPGRGRTALASPNARCARDLGKGRSSAHPPLPAPPRARVTPLVRESTADSSRPLLLAPNLGQRPWRRLWHHPVSSVVGFVGRFCPMEDGI